MKTDSPVAKLTLLILTGIFLCLTVLIWELWPRTQTESAVAVPASQDSPGAFRRLSKPLPPLVIPSTRTGTVQLLDEISPPPPVQAETQTEVNTSLVGLQAALGQSQQQQEPFVELAPEPDVIVPTGAILGKIRLDGTPPPEIAIRMDTVCARLHPGPVTTRHYLVGAARGLADVLVYVKEGLPEGPYELGYEAQRLSNTNCLFEPYILAMQTGQTLRIVNDDLILHNVHGTPKLSKGFNFGMPLQGQTRDITFGAPELFIRLKCDVHPWMFAYASVFDHPYFAVTDINGTYQFAYPLRPGRYMIAAIHRKAGELTREISLREGETLEVDFIFQVPQRTAERSNPTQHSTAKL